MKHNRLSKSAFELEWTEQIYTDQLLMDFNHLKNKNAQLY